MVDTEKVMKAVVANGWKLSYMAEDNDLKGDSLTLRLHRRKEDPEAWRAEYRKKQAAGVKFEFNWAKYGSPIWLYKNNCDFTGKKEDYREVPQEEHKPTIPHLKERILWLQQREAGTNEFWRCANGITGWSDVPVDEEPAWHSECSYEVKPKTVKWYFALIKNGLNQLHSDYNRSKESKIEFIERLTRTGFTIIGNVEEREVEV